MAIDPNLGIPMKREELTKTFMMISNWKTLWSPWFILEYFSGKWNESGFRPPLCTYRLNWARRTSWGWWDEWDDTVLQTQDSKFEPWRSEAEHATSRSRRLPTILTFTRGWGRNIFVSFKPPRPETEPRTLAWKAAVLTTSLGTRPFQCYKGHNCNSECRIYQSENWPLLWLCSIYKCVHCGSDRSVVCSLPSLGNV